MAKDGMAEIGKISICDVQTSFLYFLRGKTQAGCASYIMVREPLTDDAGKSDVLSDYGACNDLLFFRLEQHPGWGAMYAVAYRNDLATAQLLTLFDNELTTQEVPCLFLLKDRDQCLQSLVADAMGLGDLGLPIGGASFGDQKIETFVNRATGKATAKLNGKMLRVFDNAKEFYLSSVEGETDFGLFVFFLLRAVARPGCWCFSRNARVSRRW